MPVLACSCLVLEIYRKGYGGNRTAENKKSRALAGVSIDPGHRGYPCPLPCLCPCLCRCLCLSWPVPALSWRYTGKGSGSHWFSFLKRPQNINAWNWVGVALSAQGKRQRVRAKVADGGNPIEHGQASIYAPNFFKVADTCHPCPVSVRTMSANNFLWLDR